MNRLIKSSFVAFLLAMSSASFATSPMQTQYTCSAGFYSVNLSPGYGGYLNANTYYGPDSANLSFAGYNGTGNQTYRGASRLGTSYQVLLNETYGTPSITIYQDNIYPVRWLANIYCRRGF